ncbi:MAG: hypothetical protein D3924_11850, partial [Candidatus Electrothrix sp. AR4]|nr:hypothetical protein [Candidatus Electrothrix sp. AR4]
ADMNDSFHSRFFRRPKHGLGVADSIGMGEGLVVEAHPIGVIEDGNSLKGFFQFFRLIEMKGKGLYPITKRIFTLPRVGDRMT